MTQQTSGETLEEIADRIAPPFVGMGGIEDHYGFLNALLADPAILDHIPAVKALREENARLQMAEHALQQAIYDDSNEYLSRITALESQLAELRQGGEAVATVESWTNGSHWRNYKLTWHKEVEAGTKLYTRPQPAIPPGHVQVPDWHGYALLGTGRYILNASPPPMDPDLGAEFCITLATDEDRSDNRQIGEIRDNTRTTPYQPEEIAIRIGFLTPQALDAMEAQLTILRKDHWPETIAPSVPVAEKALPENVKLLLLKAHRQLETEYRQQTRATEAKRVANGTCGESPGGASSIALLAESGYISSIGKRNQEVRDEIFAMLAAPADSKEGE